MSSDDKIADPIESSCRLLATNVVLQVHKSHFNRVVDFLPEAFNDNSLQIIDTIKSVRGSKTCSLVFLNIANVNDFSERLAKYSFIYQAINKTYVLMSNRTLLHDSYHDKSIGADLRIILEKEVEERAELPKMVVKIDTFPPRIKQKTITDLDDDLAKSAVQDVIDIAPTNHNHTMSVILIERGHNDPNPSILVGIAPSDCTVTSCNTKTNGSNDDDVCRAYHKLAEAFERYQNCYKNNGWPFHTSEARLKRKSSSIIAVDCGAAPGGWSKYLIEQTACDEVHSIDPGKLSDSVCPYVNHLQMNGQDAIPELNDMLKKQESFVSIWVSDMCVHEITQQVDMILLAKSTGILESKTAFVLTIKCNIGHAKQRHDELTRKEVARLEEAGAYDMLVVHLFSNRIGERTLIGFLET
eukprot:scaffold17603_cov83-Cyclotella_meneghiniana.AAC.1